ncbi:MAG TPA: F0F1 ATP synthase subunit A [Alphaproteobacteria bacterium]|nr:F0F1 ATP synthase subunit A [Alphaproteobacteria bacterium]
MQESPLAARILFHVGPVPIAQEVVTTWAIMLVLVLVGWLSTRRLQEEPGPWQMTLEAVVDTVSGQIREITRRDPAGLLPLVATLFLFIATANLSALLPGVMAPTANIETPAALAGIVFFAVHAFGVREQGLGAYLRGYLKPTPIMLPLNVLSEFTRIFSLMVRLFGNIMSHEFVIGIVIALAGLLVPVPFMALTILIGLIQAYIFTVLATVFIAAGIGAVER